MSRRRGSWLSGLIMALVGAVWMVGQVIGGVVSLVGGLASVGSVSPMILDAIATPLLGAA